MYYEDRRDAGRALASALRGYAGRPDVLVLGLPRGGVPLAHEVALALNVPLDVFVVRKLGTPGQEELALGALASGGVRVLNQDVITALRITPPQIEQVAAREYSELERREREYRGNRPPLNVSGRTVILVDDGLATGSTMRAAVAALRSMGPEKIVVAVPVAAPASCAGLKSSADELICLHTPQHFYAVGEWYRYFDQTTDEEVREILRASEHQHV